MFFNYNFKEAFSIVWFRFRKSELPCTVHIRQKKLLSLLSRRKNVEKEKRRRGKYKLRRCNCTIISKSRCMKWLALFKFFFLLIKMSECLNGIYRTYTRPKCICTEKHCNLDIKVQKANSWEKKKFTALKNFAARNMNRNKYGTD